MSLDKVERSVLGVHRAGYTELSTFDEETIRIQQMLARALHTRSVIAFVGSGVSSNFGYPQWSEMFKAVKEKCEERLADGEGLTKRTKALWGALQKAGDKDSRLRLSWAEAGLAFLGSCDRDLQRAEPLIGVPANEDGNGPQEERKRTTDSPTQAIVRELWKGYADLAQAEKKYERENNPLKVLMRELEITHFFTLNYDDLIERVWERVHHPELTEEPGAEPTQRMLSRTVVSQMHEDEAVAFACRAFPRASVMYGHGHAGVEDDPLILSDEHYKMRYAGTAPRDEAYREGLGLLHQAGGLLFIGVGLEERDLMRPMRELLANRLHDYEPPFFALLNSKGREQDEIERIYFRQAYGVHVLFYEPDESLGEDKYAQPLCEQLQDLVQTRRKWFDAWLRIPAARVPAYHREQDRLMMKMRHRRPTHCAPQVDVPMDHPVTLVHMRAPGMGSQDIAHHLVKQALEARPHGRVFAANLYLTMDLLTVIEAAGDFLAGQKRARDAVSPLDHLFSALKTHGHTLILAGVDRLLQPEGMRSTGEAALQYLDSEPSGPNSLHWVARGVPSGVVEQRFFRRLAAEGPSLEGRILLIASQVPSLRNGVPPLGRYDTGVDPSTLAGKIAVANVKPASGSVWLEALRHEGLTPRESHEVLHIHRLLRGHQTAMRQLVGWIVDFADRETREDDLFEFRTKISATQVGERPVRVLRMVLRRFKHQEDSLISYIVLMFLSHFTTPVTPRVISTLLDAGRVKARPTTAGVQEVLERLEELGFCYRTTCEVGTTTYAPVHGARQWLGETLRGYAGASWSGVPQRFSLPGFTRDPDYERLLSPKALDALFQKVECLTAKAREALEQHGRKDEIARTHFRAAVDLVRTHLGLSAIRRCHDAYAEASEGTQPLYARYHQLLLALSNLMQDAHEDVNYLHHYEVEGLSDTFSDPDSWLYAGEIIWLTNELALIPYTEGQIQDTVPYFRKSFRAQKLVDGRRKTWRWAREQMFEGAVLIDRAMLGRAHKVLKEAHAVANDSNVDAEDLMQRCHGYLGLCMHLMGDHVRAKEHYGWAIDSFSKQRNFRAYSLALRLRGDLHRHLGNLDKADHDLNAALLAAERGYHPDLRMAAQTSKVLLWIRKQKTGPFELEALSHDLSVRHRQLDVIYRYAQSIGSRRLEVSCNVARVALQVMGGDLQHAWHISRQNLAITRSYGMKLEFIRMLALAGYVSYKRGHQSNSLLQAGRIRAERNGLVHTLNRIRRLDART